MPPWLSLRLLPLLLFGLAGAGAVYAGFAPPDEQVAEWFRASGFYLTFAGLILWLTLVPWGQLSWARARTVASAHGIAILLAAALTACMFLTSEPHYRVLADETNLMGVAMDMYEHHSFRNITEWTSFYHGAAQTVLATAWDKRPLLFSLLVYLAHLAFGYSAEVNGFLVVGLCGFGALVSFYALISRFASRNIALCGMGLLAAFPLNVLWTTSCGFEIPNLFFGILAFIAFDRLLERRTAAAATFLLATLLMVSQVRYESALFALCLGPWVPFLMRRPEWKAIPYRAALIPPLFLPVVWQRRVSMDQSMFQMADDKPPFALEWLSPNLEDAYNYFTAVKPDYGTVPALFWMAAAGLVVTLVWLALKRRDAGLRMWAHFIAASLVVLTHGGILFLYFWGKLTAQYAIRLGIIFTPFLVILSLVPIYYATRNGSRFSRYLLVGTLGLLLYHWPAAGANTATAQLQMHRELRSIRGFLDREFPDKDLVLFSDITNLYTPFRYNAVQFHRLRSNPAIYRGYIERGLTQNLIAILRIRSDGSMQPSTQLPPGMEPETLYETAYNGAIILRVVRLLPNGVQNAGASPSPDGGDVDTGRATGTGSSTASGSTARANATATDATGTSGAGTATAAVGTGTTSASASASNLGTASPVGGAPTGSANAPAGGAAEHP